MVLNFFQLKNFTDFAFDVVNTENPKDNYTVLPGDTSTTHDVWLAMGNGDKGVSINIDYKGSIRRLIYMWDANWAIRYDIGTQGSPSSIAVNGNKDFWIEVSETKLVFKCYRGTFTGDVAEVVVGDWQGQLGAAGTAA